MSRRQQTIRILSSYFSDTPGIDRVVIEMPTLDLDKALFNDSGRLIKAIEKAYKANVKSENPIVAILCIPRREPLLLLLPGMDKVVQSISNIKVDELLHVRIDDVMLVNGKSFTEWLK